MFRAEIDAEKCLLRISFSGTVPADEARRCAEQIEPLVGLLPTGFRLLTDLSALESMELGCAPYVKRVMDVCNNRAIALVVRVIPDPRKDIGLNIMALFHYRRSVRIVTCETMAQAEKVLAD
jgi:hypothetical protein